MDVFMTQCSKVGLSRDGIRDVLYYKLYIIHIMQVALKLSIISQLARHGGLSKYDCCDFRFGEIFKQHFEGSSIESE